MRTFTDNTGRAWTIAIHVLAVKRVRSLVGVDLYALVGEGFAGLQKLLADPVSLVDVIYCLCKEEADKRSTTDEDFGRAMAGDSIERATHAFIDELIDFFPDPRVRAGLQKTIEKARALESAMLTQAETILDSVDPETIAKGTAEKLRGKVSDLLSELTAEPSSGSSGNSPGSLESIRIRSRSASSA